MRPSVSVAVVAMMVLATVPTTASQSGSVVISEVHPRPASDGREFIELHNPGGEAVELAGWNLTDGINTFTFDGWTLAAGGHVVVWGGGNQSALGPTWKANVWNNGGDTVRLLRPDGAVAHQMEYGTSEVPVPGEGMSLHGSTWSEGHPTPGQGQDGQGGVASATVQDVPPEATWIDPPSSVRPGQNVTIAFQVHDANGDPIRWSLVLDGGPVRNGTLAGHHEVDATAPTEPGEWTWALTLESTTHQVTHTQAVSVSTGPFRILLPETGIHFPDLVPGEQDVEAAAPFTIVHQGDTDATPWLDVSPFRRADGELPVDGNLRLRWDDGVRQQTVDYEGPLQELPGMSPGDRVQVTFVLLQVPDVLPAGTYRSSFTVVA